MCTLQDFQDFIQTSDDEDIKKTLLYSKEDCKIASNAFKNINAKEQTYSKGLSFEKCVELLFKPFATTETRVKDETNEIDIFVDWNSAIKVVLDYTFSDVFETTKGRFLIECKNYPQSRVGVTWISKFSSVLELHKFNLGIIFSRKGITGKGSWKNGEGFIRKYALKYDKYVLNACDNDINDILENGIFAFLDKNLMYLKHNIALPIYDNEE